jgi:serine/threonine protein kinase/Tfp pilus assembly protein PilF
MVTSIVTEDLERLLGERYHIEREIARGGMAKVYLAHDSRHDRQVALKVMNPEISLTLGRERFLREIHLTAKLSHPNILTIHDSGEAGDYLWYVMPYVEGETLRRHMEKNGPLRVDETVRLMCEAAEAIGYAHSLGVIHRDIKPENILLSRGHAVIADFGIARAIDAARDDHLTATGSAIGTTAYMSPEQALAEEVDARSDVWALGCVMYEMLAGRQPFGAGGREVIARALAGRAEPIGKVRPDIPEEIERIVQTAIARDKSERFPTATELADALGANRTGSGVRAGAMRRISPAVIYGAMIVIMIAAAVTLLAIKEKPFRPDTPRLRLATMSRDSIARELYEQAEAQAARRTGDGWSQAIGLYSQALARDSSFSLAWAKLARTVSFAYGRASGVPGFSDDSLLAIARRASEKSLLLAPDDPATWVVKSRVSRLMDVTDNRPRLFQLRKAIALDSMYFPAWFELGLVMQEELDDRATLQAFSRAAELDPSNTEVLSFLGLHYLWTGEYEKGVKWADSAVNLDPTYALARDATGQLALELGRLAEARRQFETQARLNKGREQGNSYALLARIHAVQGDMAGARDYMKRAFQAIDSVHPNRHESPYIAAALAAMHDTLGAVRFMKQYEPREDLHFQLHLKRDPGLRWIRGSKWERELLLPDPRQR